MLDLKRPPLSKRELADYLKVSLPTISRYVQRGVLPRPIRLSSHRTVWSPDAVNAALEKLTTDSPAAVDSSSADTAAA